MGSIAMEPEDIATYIASNLLSVDNYTNICTSVFMIHSNGFFFRNNPLLYSLPLTLIQFAFSTGIIVLTSLILRPLGQPLIIAQILGGIILGPSILGRIEAFIDSFFPLRSFLLLDVLASFGFMFCSFLIGVQTDPSIIKKVDRKTFAIGFVTVALPSVLTHGWSSILKRKVRLDSNIAASLPAVALAQSVLAFPTVATFLQELKILNSNFGRVAMSSSIVSGMCSFCVISISLLAQGKSNDDLKDIFAGVATCIVVALVIILLIWPALKWMTKSPAAAQPMDELHVLQLFVGVMITGLFSHSLGLHTYFGPFILGLTIPAGPPVGSALTQKLELIICWVFLPIFFVKIGLVIDVGSIGLKNFAILQSTALVGAFGKFMAAFLTSLLCTKMPITDAISLGLVTNAQGFLELGLFEMLKSIRAMDNEAFIVMCISMILVTGGITPIIKRLYDPSKRYRVYKRRSVMHTRPNSQLPILVCIYDQDDVEATIDLLKALCPTDRRPLSIYLLHLIELVGRANPLLIHHKLMSRPSIQESPSEHVVNAFRKYEQRNQNLVTVHPFTAISPSDAMHDDICTIALDKKTSLIIAPFYRLFHARKQRIINENVLEKAPCSVAILVHRGDLFMNNSFKSSFKSSSSGRTLTNRDNPCYHVAILFLGGADDREALTLGARMAEHPNINLTLIRLLVDGSIVSPSEDVEQTILDNAILSEFRENMADNYRVMYMEELVMDGSGTLAVLRSMENNYELVLVGRNQVKGSPALSGLSDEIEQNELGTIGDLLARADFMGRTTILVVQQHAKPVNDYSENHREKYEPTLIMDDIEDLQIQR